MLIPVDAYEGVFVSRKLWSHSISGDIFTKLSLAQNIGEMEKVVSGVLDDLGFSMATYHLMRVNGHGDKLHSFFSSYPDEWLKRYIDRGYLHYDMIYEQSRRSVVPFSWMEYKRFQISEKADLIFNEAQAYKIFDGFSVPIHGPGAFAVFTAVPQGTDKERKEGIEMGRGALTLLGLHVHERALALLPDNVAENSRLVSNLTAREQECLRWVAAGKNSNDISDILSISGSTVDSHLQSAMRKLNTQTRTHTVMRAAALGLIPLE